MKNRTCADALQQVMSCIIEDDLLHAKWLNTLSYLENCGARKIAACEHPTQVKEEMLKHAAEEFRHAHHLKRQIEKISSIPMRTYAPEFILGGINTVHYLDWLDLKTSRFLASTVGLSKHSVWEFAYLLVTYAIELRAEELYTLYDECLRKQGSKVIIKALLLEEKEHLNEMRNSLEKLPGGTEYAVQVCLYEEEIFSNWIKNIYPESTKK